MTGFNDRSIWALLAAAFFTLAGCSGSVENAPIESEELVGADDGEAASQLVTSASSAASASEVLETTANLNLRVAAGTSNRILHVIPDGARVSVVADGPTNGWYNVRHNGVEGWSSAAYLAVVRNVGSGERADAIARARTAVGFSYWWGHGRWLPSERNSTTQGYCEGSCPNCSHAGSYGADCSGYVAKVWQVPASNYNATSDSHPYATYDFNGRSSSWTTVPRDAVQVADALVYNANGAGHIFLFESGDGWGSMWSYEARGCATGIVHNLRTASTAFKAITRYGH